MKSHVFVNRKVIFPQVICYPVLCRQSKQLPLSLIRLLFASPTCSGLILQKEDERSECREKKFQVHSFRNSEAERKRWREEEKSPVEVEDSGLCCLLHKIFFISYSYKTVRGAGWLQDFPSLISSSRSNIASIFYSTQHTALSEMSACYCWVYVYFFGDLLASSSYFRRFTPQIITVINILIKSKGLGCISIIMCHTKS